MIEGIKNYIYAEFMFVNLLFYQVYRYNDLRYPLAGKM